MVRIVAVLLVMAGCADPVPVNWWCTDIRCGRDRVWCGKIAEGVGVVCRASRIAYCPLRKPEEPERLPCFVEERFCSNMTDNADTLCLGVE